jgi:hypothetical protein
LISLSSSPLCNSGSHSHHSTLSFHEINISGFHLSLWSCYTYLSMPFLFHLAWCSPAHPHCHKWWDFIFLWLNSISLPLCTIFSLSIHELMVVGHLHFLATVSGSVRDVGGQKALGQINFIWGSTQWWGWELLNHMVLQFVCVCEGLSCYFPQWLNLFIPTKSIQGFPLLHTLVLLVIQRIIISTGMRLGHLLIEDFCLL